MDSFFTKYDTAIFALSGVILGSLITGAINYFSKTKETKLRLTEKILDKKIQAHEHLIAVATQISTMVLLGGTTDGELKRTPQIMYSKNNMDNFLVEFAKMQKETDTWLSSKIKREISLFLDYYVNLNELSRNAKDENLQEAGVVIRNDFIDFSKRIIDVTHEYFNKDLMSLKFETDRSWHKYPQKETLKKLNKTIFFTRKKDLSKILQENT